MAFKLTPEAQERYDEWRGWDAEQKARFANLTDENLITTAKMYMAQMSPLPWAPGEPVYDAAFYHAIVPELMRRLNERRESA
jgi:hypothetical protein